MRNRWGRARPKSASQDWSDAIKADVYELLNFVVGENAVQFSSVAAIEIIAG